MSEKISSIEEIFEKGYCPKCKRELTPEDIQAVRLGERCDSCLYEPTELSGDICKKNNCSASDDVYFKNLDKTSLF